jgi:hypothetical protein
VGDLFVVGGCGKYAGEGESLLSEPFLLLHVLLELGILLLSAFKICRSSKSESMLKEVSAEVSILKIQPGRLY